MKGYNPFCPPTFASSLSAGVYTERAFASLRFSMFGENQNSTLPHPLSQGLSIVIFYISQRTEGESYWQFLGTDLYKSSVCNFRKWLKEKNYQGNVDVCGRLEDDMEESICYQT